MTWEPVACNLGHECRSGSPGDYDLEGAAPAIWVIGVSAGVPASMTCEPVACDLGHSARCGNPGDYDLTARKTHHGS